MRVWGEDGSLEGKSNRRRRRRVLRRVTALWGRGIKEVGRCAVKGGRKGGACQGEVGGGRGRKNTKRVVKMWSKFTGLVFLLLSH